MRFVFGKIEGRRAALCGLGALLLPALAAGPGRGRVLAQSGERPINLRLKFKQGEKTRYQTTLHMVMPLMTPGRQKPLGYRIDMDLVQQQEVVKTLPDGSAQVTTTVLKQENRVNGQYSPEQPVPPMTMTFDPQGRITQRKAMSAAGLGSLSGLFNTGGMAGLGHFLPEKPVKPGDVWTQSVSIPVIGANATAHSRFVGYQTVGAFRTAHIRSYVSLPIHAPIGMPMGATSQAAKPSGPPLFQTTGRAVIVTDSNIAVAEGKIVRTGSNGNFAMVITPSQAAARKISAKDPIPTHFTVDMKLSIGMNLIP